MKLLIVDDEELTRKGLIHSIDWNSLGIDTIYEADDGVHGLSLARKYKPQIVLSDVRMPRMDGVKMAMQLKEMLPECSIIFMSGYSDKAYLKAAIKLKAISYVEKPIDPSEIIDSVKEAMHNHQSLVFNRQSVDQTRYDNMAKLALRIIYPNYDKQNDYKTQLAQFFPSAKSYSFFTTVIIRLLKKVSFSQTSSPSSLTVSTLEVAPLMECLSSVLQPFKLDFIYAIKQEEYLVIHLFGTQRLNEDRFIKSVQLFSKQLKDTYSHFISIGKSVHTIDKVYESYNNAIILMHSSFFYPYNTVLINDTAPTSYSSSPVIDILPEFAEALRNKEQDNIKQLLEMLKQRFTMNKIVLVNQVKDLYYKLLLELNDAASYFHISISTDTSETILDYISKSLTFLELHAILEQKTQHFFQSFQLTNRDTSTVFLIKEYVSQNYQNENLSIKDISEHVFLSSSYVCTVFKSDTGKTLNQYLTEFRIEKAKNLLMDSRYKITDISAKVGYNDGNYFGKTFKKQVGISPSEFREQYFNGKR